MASGGKILVTGAQGQLGRDLIGVLSVSHDTIGADLEDFDIRERKAVLEYLRLRKPDIVVHAAAYTDVDGCESNKKLATAVNGKGTEHIARGCKEIGARLVYISTDYVFDGAKDRPYVETDEPNPKTVYGKSKLQGEKAASELLERLCIIRIAWVYGRHGKNFVKTMLKLGAEQIARRETGEEILPLKVVNDQFGNPTWTMDVARQIETILDKHLYGLFHVTAQNETSWFEFARTIFEMTNMPVELEPCTTEEFPRPAPRPARSSLDNVALHEAKANIMRPWDKALSDFLGQHGKDLLA